MSESAHGEGCIMVGDVLLLTTPFNPIKSPPEFTFEGARANLRARLTRVYRDGDGVVTGITVEKA